MKIQGYTFEADLHCVECTLSRHKAKPFDLSDYGLDQYGPGNDENGLPYAAEDNEGNLVHPVFSIDEMSDNHCGDCGCEINVKVAND